MCIQLAPDFQRGNPLKEEARQIGFLHLRDSHAFGDQRKVHANHEVARFHLIYVQTITGRSRPINRCIPFQTRDSDIDTTHELGLRFMTQSRP